MAFGRLGKITRTSGFTFAPPRMVSTPQGAAAAFSPCTRRWRLAPGPLSWPRAVASSRSEWHDQDIGQRAKWAATGALPRLVAGAAGRACGLRARRRRDRPGGRADAAGLADQRAEPKARLFAHARHRLRHLVPRLEPRSLRARPPAVRSRND